MIRKKFHQYHTSGSDCAVGKSRTIDPRVGGWRPLVGDGFLLKVNFDDVLSDITNRLQTASEVLREC